MLWCALKFFHKKENKMYIKSSLADKWGSESLELGWTAIPSSLLLLQKTLGITPIGLNVLMNLIASWWEAPKNPYVSQQMIADRIGTSKRTIQRAVRDLENLRLIEVKRTDKSHPVFKGRNVYDLNPLVVILIKMTPSLKHMMEQKNDYL